MKSDTYVFVKGFFDTLDLFSEEIETELIKTGARCINLCYETMEEDIAALLADIREGNKPSAAICFNNLGYSIGNDKGANLWDMWGIPYVNILMDHPFHCDRQLLDMPQNARIFVIDKNHIKYINRYYPHIKYVKFLPHAGCENVINEFVLQNKSEIRDIDVLYAGNLSRVLVETLIPDFDSIRDIDGAEFSGQVLESLIKNPSQTTEDAVLEGLLKAGLKDLDLDTEKYYINAFRFLDGFAVSYYRELAVRVLVENGIKVHVLGLGWEQCDWSDNPNLHIEGKVDAVDVIPYMLRSKIALNTLTWFKAGAHDRIFNGMLCGCAVVSDESSYLKENFRDKKDIVLFKPEEFVALPSIVRNLLSDDENRKQISNAGENKAQTSHVWKNRLEEILKCLNES